MNETKVVFKTKLEMEEFLVKSYKESPNSFSFLLEEESQNLYFKGLFMDKGSVISDRKMRTLKSELYRQLTQDFGYRVVRDEHLAYYFYDQETEKLYKKLTKYLRIMSSLPDYFFDHSLQLPLDEYILESDNLELQNLKINLDFCKEVYDNFLENKIASASTTEVLVDHLKFNQIDKIFIFESYFNRLPEVLKESLGNAELCLLSYEQDLNWKNQLDLFKKLKNNNNIEIVNFDNQVEEVRFLLSKLKEDPENTAVLYPQNKGFENLFSFYQREFFTDFIIEKKVEKEPRVKKAVDLLLHDYGVLDSFSFFRSISKDESFNEKKNSNFNKVKFDNQNEEEAGKISFSAFVDKLSEKGDLSEELDFISEMQISLPSGLMLDIVDWSELLNASFTPISKGTKIASNLNIKRVDQFLNGDFKRIFICGWGEDFFKPKISSVLSQKTLGLIEKDLGFNAWSIENSIAKKLFIDPNFLNEEVEIVFSTPKVDDIGKIVDKSVFSFLMEKEKLKDVESVSRNNDIDCDYKENSLIESKEYKVSASSLALYDDCPFKFYMYKVLGIFNEEPEDYFLDPMKEGALIHELLENFVVKHISKEEFIKEVRKIVESNDSEFNKFKKSYVEKIADRIWGIISEERKFLESNNIKVAAVEKSFEFYCSLEDRDIRQTKEKFKVRGSIDRIDKDLEDNMLIYDYKRGTSGISMFKNYKGNELKPQLFLYCLAAKQGFLGAFNNLAGFQYINTTEQKRSGGFVSKNFKGSSIVKEASAQSYLENDVFEEKMGLFLDNFWEVLDKIDKGLFEPKPRSHEVCLQCEWKPSCRKSETFL